MRLLVLVLLAQMSCRSADGYKGTIVVGSDYVQALVTASGDKGCPPRIQTIGQCVRTPPTADLECQTRPACVSTLAIKAPGVPTITASGAFASVPWLTSARPERIEIEIRGCGGTRSIDVAIGEPMSPFAKTSARLSRGRVNLAWTPAAGADQVCALWRTPDAVEVCCAPEGGTASFPAPATSTDVRLSRGVLIDDDNKGLQVYKTSESANLIAP